MAWFASVPEKVASPRATHCRVFAMHCAVPGFAEEGGAITLIVSQIREVAEQSLFQKKLLLTKSAHNVQHRKVIRLLKIQALSPYVPGPPKCSMSNK
jgi:hypothetical protein